MTIRVLGRLGQAGLTLIAAAVIVWALQVLTPADPARQLLIARGLADPAAAEVAALRAELGLDQPAFERFGRWLAAILRGDLGTSWNTGRPVAAEIGSRLPATVRLCLTALGLAAVLGVPAALLAARWRGQPVDYGVRFVIFAAASVPSYVIGTVLLDGVVVGWGLGTVLADGSWRASLLPAVPLAIAIAATWARVFRASLVEASSSTVIDVALARGSRFGRALFVHAVPPATPALLTAVAMSVGGLLAGAAVVETVFTWPGIGRYLIESIIARDVPAVQILILFGVVAFLASSLVVDALIALIRGPVR